VYLGYLYAKKQKIFENNNEKYRRVRIIISDLLQIWRELSKIEYYSSSTDLYADLVFINKQLVSVYFNIDHNKINELRNVFEKSKEEIKSINVALFYSLENGFKNFNSSLEMFESSDNEIKYNDTDFKNTLKEILLEIVRDLEEIIIKASENLPKKEKEEVENIINEHHLTLEKTEFDYDVPVFLINLINNSLPLNEKITGDEIKYFFNDDTVKLIFYKLINPLKTLFSKKKPLEVIKLIFDLSKNPDKFDIQINEKELIIGLQLNDFENKMFQNNLGFYKLICSLYKKFQSPVPFGFKRGLLQINNGTISLQKELEKEKNKIIAKEMTYKVDHP
jgi:hypothetical protein